MKRWSWLVLFAGAITLHTTPANSALAYNIATAQKILKAANSSVGKKMWFGYGLSSGQLGCAAALCNVLKASGITSGKSATVVVVRRQLLAERGAKEIVIKSQPGDIDDQNLTKLAKPGDILMAYMAPPPSLNGGPNAHCGIIGEDGTVYTNDWNDGIWKHSDIHKYFDFYPHIRVIRLP